jgi:hypothetical protein
VCVCVCERERDREVNLSDRTQKVCITKALAKTLVHDARG